ncbi:MAG: class I SAM-dependent methyltransferase [Candidatus Helarchaeota archaeon]
MSELTFFLKTYKKNGKLIHDFLAANQLLNINLHVQRTADFLFFPLLRELDSNELNKLNDLNIYYDFEKRLNNKMKYKKLNKVQDELQEVLSKDELELIPHSFDVIGHVLILDLPHELQHVEKKVAKTFLKNLKAVKTVIKKMGPVKGDLRLREFQVLDGNKNLETLYKENGCRYKLDISKVFFNSRLSTERLRIARMALVNEKILDMFAGVGPFTCLLAKQQMARVVAVDLNPNAIHYLKQNVKLNKIEHLVDIIEGNIRNILDENFYFQFDRIIMNLPEKSQEFLDLAAKGIKKEGGTIHLYCFLNKTDSQDTLMAKIKDKLIEHDRKVKNVNFHKVRLVAPYEWQVCIDIFIE